MAVPFSCTTPDPLHAHTPTILLSRDRQYCEQFSVESKETSASFLNVTQKENIPRNNRHMTRCSTSLVIKEIQIKTIMRYHLMPVRIAFIKKTKANKCWHGCREKRTTLHCWYKLVWPLWKTILRFLPKLKIGLWCAWAIPLLEIYTNDMKTPTWKISAHLCSE